LARTEPDATLAVPVFAQFLADPTANPADRHRASQALVAFGPRARDAIPEIKAVLLNPMDPLFNYAYVVMAAIGPKALPTLTELAKNPDGEVQKAAQRTLEKVQRSSKKSER
jgi:HEAT repeat protein